MTYYYFICAAEWTRKFTGKHIDETYQLTWQFANSLGLCSLLLNFFMCFCVGVCVTNAVNPSTFLLGNLVLLNGYSGMGKLKAMII